MTIMENIQKKTLRLAQYDFESDHKTLLNGSGKCTVEIRTLKCIAL